MTKTIVVLSGKAGVGKDTFAALLGSAWERISFADEVKKVASDLVGLHLDFFHSVDKKDTKMLIGGKMQTPRDLLISIGMYYRALNPNYWTDKAIEKIRASKGKYFVVTDWRFPNELEAIQRAFDPLCGRNEGDLEDNKGGKDLLCGAGLEKITENSKGSSTPRKMVYSLRIVGNDNLGSSHESECALDSFNFDYLIINRASLELLEEKANALGVMMGEPEATIAVWKELYPKALGLCRRFVSNKADVQDLASDAMHALINQLISRFSFKSTLWAFAYRFIYYRAQNYRRKLYSYSKHINVVSYNLEELETNSTTAPNTPLLRQQINEAIGKLSASDQELFKLRCDGWKHKEIAVHMGITPGGCRRRLFLIKGKLQVSLKDVYLDFI